MEIQRGKPLPLGPHRESGGINFALFAPYAEKVELHLFRPGSFEVLEKIVLEKPLHTTGSVWHVFVSGQQEGTEYGYLIHAPGVPDDIYLLDPYAPALVGGETWGDRQNTRRRNLVIRDDFDWEDDISPGVPFSQTVIYELHVRGFTRHQSSGVDDPGTYAGLVAKIPYLKDLGITAVELLPVTEFDETNKHVADPSTGKPLLNYWGYDPVSYLVPKAGYAAEPENGGALTGFKQMVKAFHKAGIEVFLDMVFNHTGEDGDAGPVINFRALAPDVYYLLDKNGKSMLNFTGCGNTVNCNHPVTSDLILASLRYWVTDMHVDGFRFDLASIMCRGEGGSVLSAPPVIERISKDPVLGHVKLIAEAWDAAGLYQVGSFPAWQRWAEWNDKFRDILRRYIRGDEGVVPEVATRMAGSADLYRPGRRKPYHSINFITSHDGFTLRDLVSYNSKHNEANGEQNRDGSDNNLSWNCGIEGEPVTKRIQRLRIKQMKNFLAHLFLAQGTPMMIAGDEFGRTQQGNNNAYCQDNPVSWLDWAFIEKNKELHHFTRQLIHFRKQHGCLQRHDFFEDDPLGTPPISWHGTQLNQPDWGTGSHNLAFYLLPSPQNTCHIFVISNMSVKRVVFQLPTVTPMHWYRFADTSLRPPDDISEIGKSIRHKDQSRYSAAPRSTVVLVAKKD
jgi:isoamylase